ERYMGSPHRLGYRLYNLYGDSIHGSAYYMPWEHLYGGNHFTKSLYVGCVCGGISHFGAFAALANGVPSLTCGEPGHCAYVLWVNGKWVPGNSVSWERGLHWQPVLNMWSAFSSLHLGSELYTKLDADTHASNTYRVLAHHAASTKKDKLAINYFKDATTAQPINIGVWQEYNNYLTANKGDDMKLLCEMQDNLCYTVAPRYPEVISEFLAHWVYPKMKAAKLPVAELMTRYHVFWNNVAQMGPERWRIEKFGRRQIELLQYQDPPDGKEIPPPDPKLALPVFNLMMNNLASKSDYLPVVIGWGEEMAKGLGGTHASTIATLSKEIAKTGTGAMGGGDNTKVTGQLMMSAAKSKDIATFQRLGANSADQVETPADMPELPEMPGKLLSADGLLATSSTCNHDSPVSHWGVIRPSGGRFHTDKDENAWASVMMPKPGYVNGVVIVTNGGNHQRLNNMVVQISDDGESWSTIKELGECKQRVIRLDFQERLGRHVRILRKGGPEYFHLNGIYVYGRDAA
ncbi:MAG: discoidin domain-containing protein, partial [Akkermansia sp.]|nr:discoidin domain-containing protein [Akkermansia sp.]